MSQSKKEFLVEAKYIACIDQGFICGRPATFLDTQRGGMVCGLHVPLAQKPMPACDPRRDPVIPVAGNKKDKPIADPIKTIHLIAPTSRRQAFYRLWIEAGDQGFKLVKESGAENRVGDRRTWEAGSLEAVQFLFERRICEKTNPLTKHEPKYQLSGPI